jgi:predicted KAP-like P-loop ATPase
MWADNETADDLIGFQVHADLICEVIRDKQLLPVTIGVFGDWGIGKSSIMQMIQQKLDAEHPKNAAHKKDLAGYAVLYFNGWLFEGYDDAKSALLSSILEQLSEHKRFGPKLRDRARGLLGRVNFMRIAKIGWDRLAVPAIATMLAGGDVQAIAALNAVIVPTSGDVDEVIKDSNEAKGIASIRSFRDDFAKLLKQSDIVTLVVLIDDLDRCSPERLIENLEAIKLFLSVENTAFVIGADPRMVRHAITVRYKDSIDAIKNGDRTDVTHLVTDYLEKLIQIPYTLPRLSPSEIETYLTLLFCKRDLDPEDYQICVSACERARGINRFKSFGGGGIQEALKGKTLPEKLLSALLFSSSAAPLITEGLKGNPRQVKRFLNAYFLRSKLANVAKLSSVREDVLIKLMKRRRFSQTATGA